MTAKRLAELNAMPAAQAEAELMRVCGSKRWAQALIQSRQSRPFESEDDLKREAIRIWNGLKREDWLEAFSHHPRIGEKALREKFASTASWASDEQKGASQASEELLQALALQNENYFHKFGHVFLIFATGKTAEQMLTSLNERIHNDPETELRIAAAEQAKILSLRLEKWLNA